MKILFTLVSLMSFVVGDDEDITNAENLPNKEYYDADHISVSTTDTSLNFLDQPTKCNYTIHFPYKSISFSYSDNLSDKMNSLVQFYKKLFDESEDFKKELIKLFDLDERAEDECATLTLTDRSTRCSVNPYYFPLIRDVNYLLEEIRSLKDDTRYEELLDKILDKYNLYIDEIWKMKDLEAKNLQLTVHLHGKSYKQKPNHNGSLFQVEIINRTLEHLIKIDDILDGLEIHKDLIGSIEKKDDMKVKIFELFSNLEKKASRLFNVPNFDLWIHNLGDSEPEEELTTTSPSFSGTDVGPQVMLIENSLDFEFFNNSTNLTQEQNALINNVNCKPSLFDSTNAIFIPLGILFSVVPFSIILYCFYKLYHKKKRTRTWESVELEERNND